jgi:ribosomal protein S21
MEVKVNGETKQALEIALTKFNKMVKESGMMDTLRKKEHFVKKSIRLRDKRSNAAAQRIREQNKLKKNRRK